MAMLTMRNLPDKARRALRVPAAALFAVCAAQTASAAETGSFELIMTAVHDYTTLEHAGRTITVGPLQGTARVVAASGAPFSEGANHRVSCVVYGKRSKAGIDLEAPCTITDEAGDRLYVVSVRRAGDIAVGGGGKGSYQIQGGTGKFSGLGGDCAYKTSYLPDKWLVTRTTCTWRKP